MALSSPGKAAVVLYLQRVERCVGFPLASFSSPAVFMFLRGLALIMITFFIAVFVLV